MNILVTGATGFIGSHLCKALVEKNYEVFALSHSRKNDYLVSLTKAASFHLINGDICSLPAMQAIIDSHKIDTIIHLAAHLNYGPQEANYNPLYIENNVKGTLSILQAAYLAKCPRIIYASTRDVYSVPEYLPIDEDHPTKPPTIYGLTKLHGENYCEFYARNYRLHVVVLRYAGVYGYGKNAGVVYNFIRAALEGQPFRISSDGNQTRDLVYVGDAVNATLDSLNIIDGTDFDIFNIGSGSEISLNELAIKVIEATGVSTDFGYTPATSGDRFILDINRARQALNYQPRSLENALAEYTRSIRGGG